MTYIFSIPSIPIAQPRARAVAFQGHARMHDAPKSHPIHAFKATVRQVVSEKMQSPLTGPVFIAVEFIFPRPANHYGTGKNSDVLKATAPHFHTARPDLDNTVKGCLDALKGIAWNDDAQVAVYAAASKRYVSGRDEAPGTKLTIGNLELEH